ncbi:MAG: murein biosynthesis integral membrane protein MurJ [Pseudomonadota bacterium]
MAKRSIFRAFIASVAGTGFSRVVGLFRELAIARVLGASTASDAFFMAFTIPSMFRRFVADEGLTGALVPLVADAEEKDGAEMARKLAGRTVTALIGLGLLIAIAAIPLAPWLVDLFAPGFRAEPEKFALTVRLTRVMMPFVMFVSLVSWCEGMLNHRDHFFIPKIAPGVVSAVIIAAAFWPAGGEPQRVAQALSWGVLAGGAAHLLICLPPLYRHWGFIRPRFDWWAGPRFRILAREMGKVAAIGLMAQVNVVVLRSLASHLGTGAVSWYWNATRLVDFTQGVVAVGVGSAVLPALAEAVARSDWGRLSDAFARAVRLAGALLMPAAVFVALLATPFVALLYRQGAYTWTDVQQTALTLQLLVPYMLGLAGIQIVKKPFFALNRRNSLVAVGALGVALTWGLGAWLAPLYGVAGLALALSASTCGQLAAYLVLLRRVTAGRLALAPLGAPLLRMLLAALPAGLLAWGLCRLGAWEQGFTIRNAALLAAAGGLGGLLYLGVAWRLGVPEVQEVYRRVVGRFRR